MVSLIGGDISRICEAALSAAAAPLNEMDGLVRSFLLQAVTPERVLDFENAVAEYLREAGRRVLETVYNQIEPAAAEMPKRLEQDSYEFSRKKEKTNCRDGVATVFGKIELARCSYEPLQEGRDDGQKSCSPLELCLGIVAGNATPALAERVGRTASGHTQQELLELLERDHGVRWSSTVLRQVMSSVSEGIADHLHQTQNRKLLDLLGTADASKGRHKITLSVGRDGIMLPMRGEKTYKEAAVGTVTVYDRRGHRLGTVYLGQMPQAHQTALSDQLTRLLTELLQEWKGAWPRLVYVTDAGHHPTEYFDTVLTHMEHPRQPGHLMEWIRVVDFFHASEYVAKLARALFDDDNCAAHGWQHRMRHMLKHEPNAVFRVLHSAAKHHSERLLSAAQEKAYQKAYQYLNNHQAYMNYREYRRLGLPIGSGVTEAACKTVFTQRFKQSGMTWGLKGGGVILALRLADLSRVWEAVYRQFLLNRPLPRLATKPLLHSISHKIPA